MTDERGRAYAALDLLAAWSQWAPFADAAPIAPRSPGVYQIRVPHRTVVYVGMAGERRGQGIRGRLSIYRRGKGAVSGFGEAALDRALANVDFIEEHLAAVRSGESARASGWARDAIEWLNVEIRWAEGATQTDAVALEHAAVQLLRAHAIWNRVAMTGASVATSSARGVVAPAYAPGMEHNVTVMDLTRELGYDDNGRAVRAALRKGFPDHVKNSQWDPLSPAQVAHVRTSVSRKR